MNTLFTHHSSLFTAAATAFTAAAAGAATPVVTSVSMSQSSFSRLVTIDYTFTGDPAVITLDVQTNANTSASADDPGWTSIGGEAVCNAQGDVWKKVETGSRTITWRPDKSWPDNVVPDGCARAVVTAWATNDTPAYMVVDISQGAVPDSQRFYQAAEFVPGGVTNDLYKTTTLLMRKINAGDVTWTMGSTPYESGRGSNEGTHQVTLADGYYIGVYEITISQYKQVKPTGATAAYTSNPTLPMENVSYNEIRASSSTQSYSDYQWPNAPKGDSFLGRLRDRTQLDFDLPSEAQWEFAARSGHGSGYWNDGSSINDANLANLACFNKTAPMPVGSFAPSSWGLYDMHGNVWEWCLDWYEDNIATATAFDGQPYGGRVNIHPTAFDQYLSGATVSGGVRAYRGGAFKKNAASCRPAVRDNGAPTGEYDSIGFRVVCPVGIH